MVKFMIALVVSIGLTVLNTPGYAFGSENKDSIPQYYKVTQLNDISLPIKVGTSPESIPTLLKVVSPKATTKTAEKGCYLVAQATADATVLRADIKLVSLSCLNNKGKAVKDVSIKGYIKGPDGKRGLKGKLRETFYGRQMLEVKKGGEITAVITAEGN